MKYLRNVLKIVTNFFKNLIKITNLPKKVWKKKLARFTKTNMTIICIVSIDLIQIN